MTSTPRAVHVDELVACGDLAGDGGTAAVQPVEWQGQVWAYKAYTSRTRSSVDGERLQRLVEWREALHDWERDFLDAHTAWPRTIVEDEDGLSGVVVPLAEERYRECKDHVRRVPRHLTRVTAAFVPEKPYYELPEKLARLGLLGEVMRFLHARGVVVGDLQPNNVLTSAPGAAPAVLVIDCDSMVLDGVPALPSVDPGTYKLPEPRPFDVASDYYKFATLIVRCVQEENTAWDCQDERALQVMTSNDLALLRRSLDQLPDPGDDLRWQALLRSWRSGVDSAGNLWHRNDGFLRGEWAGRGVEPVPVERSGPPAAVLPVIEPPDQKSLTRMRPGNARRPWSWAAAALVVVTLAVAAMLLFTGAGTPQKAAGGTGSTPALEESSPSTAPQEAVVELDGAGYGRERTLDVALPAADAPSKAVSRMLRLDRLAPSTTFAAAWSFGEAELQLFLSTDETLTGAENATAYVSTTAGTSAHPRCYQDDDGSRACSRRVQLRQGDSCHLSVAPVSAGGGQTRYRATMVSSRQATPDVIGELEVPGQEPLATDEVFYTYQYDAALTCETIPTSVVRWGPGPEVPEAARDAVASGASASWESCVGGHVSLVGAEVRIAYGGPPVDKGPS